MCVHKEHEANVVCVNMWCSYIKSMGRCELTLTNTFAQETTKVSYLHPLVTMNVKSIAIEIVKNCGPTVLSD